MPIEEMTPEMLQEMPREMPREMPEEQNMGIEKYKEGLRRILESADINEIRSIAQELLAGDISPKSEIKVEIEQGRPAGANLRDRLRKGYGE